MANTRYKGANSSERLTLATLSDNDMFQTRHLPGTVNDADKGVSKALLQALPIAVCATAAATAAKVGTLAPESCPDFTLVNGRVIHVYFSAANTASVPTINVAGTGAIPITYPNGDYVGAWAAGTTMDLMYISITVDNTAMERWVVVSSLPVDEVAAGNMNSVTSNAVAAVLSFSTTEHFTGKYWIDEKKIYRKSFINITSLSCNPNTWINIKNNFDGLAATCAGIDSLVLFDYTNTFPSDNSPLHQKIIGDALIHYPSNGDFSVYFYTGQLLKLGSLLTIEYTKTTA